MADLPFVHFYDPVQVLELCLHCQMRMFVCIFSKLFDQFVDLLYLLLVLLLFEEKGVLFEEEEVDAVQSFEVVVGGVDELVAVVHAGRQNIISTIDD